MGKFLNTGRKDTGRTDEFSNETPEKDISDYRQTYPTDTAREESESISSGISPKKFIGIPGLIAANQYIKTISENFRENYSEPELAKWKSKMSASIRLYELVKDAKAGSIPNNFITDVQACLDILK